jgi:hypothetical protein
MDGTLTAAPKVLGEIMRCLKKAGHKVYILTGSLGETPDQQLEDYRKQQAKDLGLCQDHYDDICICVSPSFEGVAELKARFCWAYSVDFMIDDMALYRQIIKRLSPKTMVLPMPEC